MINEVFFKNNQIKRYERKFLVGDLNIHEARSIIKLHPAAFSTAFPKRQVNNAYFDSVDLKNYYDHINGTSKRLKIRLRWYGESIKSIINPQLQLKIKENQLGWKKTYPINDFEIKNGSLNEYGKITKKILKNAVLPERLKDCILATKPVILNSYGREYFISRDKKFRITIDCGICFYPVENAKNIFRNKIIDFENPVIELKYTEEYDDEAKKITNEFPFRMTKKSKYVSGIEQTLLLE